MMIHTIVHDYMYTRERKIEREGVGREILGSEIKRLSWTLTIIYNDVMHYS